MTSSPMRTPASSPIWEATPPSVANPQADPGAEGEPDLPRAPVDTVMVDSTSAVAGFGVGSGVPVADPPVVASQPEVPGVTCTALAVMTRPFASVVPYQGLGMPLSFMVPSISSPSVAVTGRAPGTYPLASAGAVYLTMPTIRAPAPAAPDPQASVQQQVGTIRQPLKPIEAGKSLKKDLQDAVEACTTVKMDLELAVKVCSVVNEFMEDASNNEARSKATVKAATTKILKNIHDLKEAAKNSMSVSLMAQRLDERDRLDAHKAEVERLATELKTMAEGHAMALANQLDAFQLLEAELETGNKMKEEIVNRLQEQLDLINNAALGYYLEVDDVLRRARALELGVTPDSQAMARWEPTAEDRVTTLGKEAQALREAGQAMVTATWDSQTPLEVMVELVEHLQEVPEIVDRLRESAARSGSEMALTMVMSWFTRGFDMASLEHMSRSF